MEPSLTFGEWKRQLRENCVRLDRLASFNNFGDYVLALLWKRGLDPSVEAIVNDGKSAAADSTEPDDDSGSVAC
jgi:hypothetical protein